MISRRDASALRGLATEWLELASLPVMEERKRLWKAVHDLRAERPVILIETSSIEDYVEASELLCEDPFLRSVERSMRMALRQAEEVGDDIVIEPHIHLAWTLRLSDYGVPVEIRPPAGGGIPYTFDFPIAGPEDIAQLRPRSFAVDREETARRKAILEEAFGGLLPVRVGNYDPFVHEFAPGQFADFGFTGNFFFGLTWQLYRFIGNDRLFAWLFDAPRAIHDLMTYLLRDRIALFEFLEREGLIVSNADDQMAGPRSYGYVSDLPAPGSPDPVRLRDLWVWAESQEFEPISPAMYEEFVLPYLAELASRFGLIYYGCCERLDDRLERILRAIPNVRSVSVSGWSDLGKIAEIIGEGHVFSRKPKPAPLSGPQANWDLLEKDMLRTREVARGANLEILFRDVYAIGGDGPRLRKWVEMTRSIFDI